MKSITGTCWCSKDYVMAYDIIIQKFWTSPIDPEENSKWVMAGVHPDFNTENGFKSKGYTFIVAGHNFAGGGKSIEHVITGLMGAGIKAVFAINFSRLQFRNAINYGLPFVTAPDMIHGCETGDLLEYFPEEGKVINHTRSVSFSCAPIPAFVREIAEAGGLSQFIRKKIADGTIADLR
ncbi:MAG: 3-isopropylmalate dehydratase [Chitinophagaceae bacterium]|nr:3-isopropylmalate dehydratase [Chitinophagaceae bacterium]